MKNGVACNFGVFAGGIMLVMPEGMQAIFGSIASTAWNELATLA
jgi:hypothetical protein